MGLSYWRLSLCFSFCCTVVTTLHLLSVHAAFGYQSTNNETHKLALLEFKAKLTYDPLGILSSWNSSLHFCQWYGVICGRRHQRVTVLNLSSLKLSGPISPFVGNLSFLRELSLQNNSFSHEIPPQIGNLHRLQVLSLYNNSIGGKIPPNISACSNLVSLYLERNQLVGEIPVELTSLTKLREIYLNTNDLTGTIPPSLGNLSFLEKLYAYRNNFHGDLSGSLGRLMNIRTLALYDNQFTGTIPSSVFNLSSIEELSFGGNRLKGNFSMSLDGFVSLPQRLRFFSVGANQLSGPIPASISNTSNLQRLMLGENYFTGTVPSLEKLTNLVSLSIAGNHLGSGEADDLKFLSGLTNATALQMLTLSVNNFGGTLPESIGNFSKKLELFSIGYNQILGNIPAEIENLVNLQVLAAPGNQLSGTIPSSIGKLKNLRVIYLSYNNFFGNIPSTIGNLTNLIEIYLASNYLQGMIHSSLGNCRNLQNLYIPDNNLTGTIPRQIFELSSLSAFLDLSINRLSGSVPNDVRNLKQLGYLSLRQNELSGEIPVDLGSCQSLEFLYLDGNFFEGSIPSSLSSLRGIRNLSLAHNNLSGKIPTFLAGLNYSIELLNLSYNNFEGPVPTEGIFRNSTATSIRGNEKLCGGIRDFGLPPYVSDQPKRRLAMHLKIIISVVSVFIGAALVLLACLFHRRSRKSKGETTSSSLENGVMRLSYQSLLKSTNGFSTDNLIGSGSFGSVYKGILYQDGAVIAVKVLNLTRRGASKSFLAECEVLRNVRHRNLVKVLTACSSVDTCGNDFKALIYEFMDNGSLDDWLHPNSLRLNEAPRALNILQRLNVVIDVACALEYLHYHSGMPIVHCDIKPSNVLLDKEMTGHLSDFGLVKFISDGKLDSATDQSSSIGARGTIGYCPPEYGLGSNVSASGDIFSFGVLLLEMFTGKRPTDDMFKEGLTIHNFVKKALSDEQITEIIDHKVLRMHMDVDARSNQCYNFRNGRCKKFIECLISIFEIGICCSTEAPQERMNIHDVISHLSVNKNKLLEAQGDHQDTEFASSLPMAAGAQE